MNTTLYLCTHTPDAPQSYIIGTMDRTREGSASKGRRVVGGNFAVLPVHIDLEQAHSKPDEWEALKREFRQR